VLLALDTSTSQAGIALYDGRVRAELVWWSGRNHARQLMPAVRDALGLVGGRVEDLSAVAAARGPGSFTGLRVGLAVARGLAFALDIPLYGFTSLEVVAAGQGNPSLPVQAVLDAGRGRVATAQYRHERGRWRQVGDILGVPLDDLVRLVRECAHQNPEGVTVAGDLSDETRHALSSLGDRVRVATAARSVRRPAILAERAWERFSDGDRPGPDDGEPIYLTRA
jgi:tRNA threonylcarbamoyladenosine biosynthesis protein TsaB